MSWYNEDSWNAAPQWERDMYDAIYADKISDRDPLDDDRLYEYVHDALDHGGGRAEDFQQLTDWLESEYGLDLDDVIDWEDYRAWYE